MQSNLLALKYTIEYLRRYKNLTGLWIEMGRTFPIESEETKKPPKQKKPEEPEEEVETEPEYPELPKEYQPFTKDTQNQENGKETQHRVVEVNFKTSFFAQRYFSNVVRGASSPFQEALLPTKLPQPSQSKQTGKEMIVRTFGKRKIDLFLPPGFKPLQPSDPRAWISRLETGGYSLELKDDLKVIRIPLVEDNRIPMMPHLREIYTRPVGFKAEEWPDGVQVDIVRRFSKKKARSQPLKVAQAVADHIASEYLYSLGSRIETDPIQALQAGAFQSDMAAYSMVGILRDIYEIPSRVVGGFRAKKYQNGKDGNSYLVIPGEAHAWVEVFHDGKWHSFDPTPIKKDKKEDSSGGENEYSDQPPDENTVHPESEQEGKKESLQGDKSSKSGDHQARLKENTQKRVDDKSQDKDKDKNKNEESLTLEELADQLELGSLELDPKSHHNALLERAMRVLLQIVLDPTQRGVITQNRLNQISFLIRKFPNVQKVYQEALIAHNKDHPELRLWVDHLVRMIPERDLNQTYQELHKINLTLKIYSKVLDHGGSIPIPRELLATLDLAQRKIHQLAHPDSQEIGIVQDLVKDFSSVPRQLLKQEYDLAHVGPNNPTKKVAKRLKGGQLNDLRLLSILSPLSDFILNSTPRPENIEIKTWQDHPQRSRGQDLLPLQRFSDMSRALLG